MATDEIEAMRIINDALEALDDEVTRKRVLAWAGSKYGVRAVGTTAPGRPANQTNGIEFSDFPSLVDAARPRDNEERALVAGYWFQTAQGQTDLDSQSLNTALKNLGQGVGNITAALGGLIERKPALVMQIKKKGSTKQARKKYRLTTAGIRAVERMLSGEGLDEGEPA